MVAEAVRKKERVQEWAGQEPIEGTRQETVLGTIPTTAVADKTQVETKDEKKLRLETEIKELEAKLEKLTKRRDALVYEAGVDYWGPPGAPPPQLKEIEEIEKETKAIEKEIESKKKELERLEHSA